MKRDDKISFILSAIINIVILLGIPKISSTFVQNRKIKVGLIQVDNDKNINKKIVEEKINKEKLKKIKFENVNVSIDKKEFERKSNLTNLKKSYNERGIINKVNQNVDIELDTKINPEKQENIKSSQENIKIVKEENKINLEEIEFEKRIGLPSGYKLGIDDGDIVARWDQNNIEPTYPEIAENKGLHGKVRVLLTIDEYGNVNKLFIEQGSGVPSINNAIEKVGHSWKIYLSKNGKNIRGEVILEYNFILK